MAEHNDERDSKHGYSVLEASNDFRGDNVAGNARDENVADRLVERDLDRYPRVGAGEYTRERLLLFNCLLFEELEIFLERGQLPGRIAGVAVHQALEGIVRTQGALRGHRRQPVRPRREAQRRAQSCYHRTLQNRPTRYHPCVSALLHVVPPLVRTPALICPLKICVLEI